MGAACGGFGGFGAFEGPATGPTSKAGGCALGNTGMDDIAYCRLTGWRVAWLEGRAGTGGSAWLKFR